MRQTDLFTKTRKEAPKDEESKNATLLIRGGFIDKVQAGVYVFLPLGFRVLKKIENIIRAEMKAMGGEEILMPALQPKNNWEITGRFDTYDSLFRFESLYSKINYVLGPTHEEIISPLLQKFISSYRDLPKYVFQIQTKFRDEKRAKSGLLRGREFMMKDLYSFHRDEEDLEDYYEKVKDAYRHIFDVVGIGEKTYLAFASGGTFSKYSHEFQTLTEAGEDTIYICDKCRVAVNEEIIAEQKVCPECDSDDFRKEKAVEVGNIFKLKTKYSQPFDLKYRDEKGKEHDVIMGCYGIGLGRLMGTIAETLSDEKGLTWPESVAPFEAHLICLSDDKEKKAAQIYDNLQALGVEVLYDNRDLSAGEKFVDADLIGIPFRLVISDKAGEKIEVKKRGEEEAKLFSEKELMKLFSVKR